MEAGARVIIKNLVSKPELNGTLAVIMQPTEAEVAQLQSQGRIKVTGGGSYKPISLKRENLTPVDESKQAPIDWTRVDGPDGPISDLASMIRVHRQLGQIDRCDEFVQVLAKLVNHQGLPLNTLQLNMHDKEKYSMMVNNVTDHFIYFFHLDQISHHLVVEVHQGRARLFQSFIIEGDRGWTAAQWIETNPQRHWDPAVKAVHAKYGGGREFSHTQFIELLDTIREIQDCTKAISDRSEEILPTAIAEAQAAWESELYATGKAPPRVEPLGDLCNYIFEHPWMVTIVKDPKTGNATVMSNHMYDRYEEYPHFVMNIPASLAVSLERAVKKLYGVEVVALNYIMIFRFRGWEKKYVMDGQGKVMPLGWTFEAASVPH